MNYNIEDPNGRVEHGWTDYGKKMLIDESVSQRQEGLSTIVTMRDGKEWKIIPARRPDASDLLQKALAGQLED